MAKRTYSFEEFSKKFWLLYVGLTIILVIAVALFCFIFFDELYDVSAWASMISGIITYIGSSILGIFVFYHSWVQVIRQNESEDICASFNVRGNDQDGGYSTYQEELICKKYPRSFFKHKAGEKESSSEISQYIQVTIANLNHTLPMTIEFKDVFYLSNTNEIVCAKPIKVRCAVDPYKPIDYKDDTSFFVGVPNEVFEQNRFKKNNFVSCFVVVRLENPKSRVKYGILHYLAGKTWMTSTNLYSEKQYNSLKQRSGGIIQLNSSDLSFINGLCSEE